MNPLRVCQVVASINRDVGGPAVSVPRLAEVLAGSGLESAVATLDYPEHGLQTPMRNVQLFSQRASWLTRRTRGFAPSFRKRLVAHVAGRVDLIHDHGLWMFPNWYARQAAARHQIPLVISPRGMVAEWSLKRGRFKKSLIWRLFEKNNFAAANMFHATSEAELESLRALGVRQPVAVIPNGIDVPEAVNIPVREILEERFPALKNRRWLLFMSRLHPKKGVFELLAAWRGLEKKIPDWHLILAGPDSEGHGDKLRQAVLADGLSRRVTFTGVLSGDDKTCALGNAGLFVLPTHSENFGLVIGEALACGTPVITTQAAPWRDLETHHCGWWIENKPEALAAALLPAMSLADEQLQEMGRNGRQLVVDKYGWWRVGEQMKAAYLWCCGRATMPDCVNL
jgi:glycosyltransferase involved in cell wall biosynthesis